MLEKENLKSELGENDDFLESFFATFEKFLELLQTRFGKWKNADHFKKSLILKILTSNFFLTSENEVIMRISKILEAFFGGKNELVGSAGIEPATNRL